MKLVSQPLIIGVEASGFGPDSYPIEIGIATENNETYCSILLPAHNWTHGCEEAEGVHGVPSDILETYGKPLD